jgi:hypothetical protein
MIHTYPQFIQWFGTTQNGSVVRHRADLSGRLRHAGGLITLIIVVSLLTPAPSKRHSGLRGARALPEPEGRYGRDQAR